MTGGCFIIVLPALYKIVTSWFLHVITCYYILLHVITYYYMLLHIITCYYMLLPVVNNCSHWWTCMENMMDISFHTVCICMLCHSKGSSFGQEGLDTMIRWIVRYATMPFIRTSVASVRTQRLAGCKEFWGILKFQKFSRILKYSKKVAF